MEDKAHGKRASILSVCSGESFSFVSWLLFIYLFIPPFSMVSKFFSLRVDPILQGPILSRNVNNVTEIVTLSENDGTQLD